jgi:hypothetical protein
MIRNRVAIVLDRSYSMDQYGVWAQAQREVLAMLGALRRGAVATAQDTRATVVLFSNSSEVVLFQTDVRNELPAIAFGRAEGNTALFDAIATAADTIRAWTPADAADDSFLVLAFTDGEENFSTRLPSPAKFQKYIAGLPNPDNWTFALHVPKGRRAQAARITGFPEGNVREWETSAAGMQEASVATQKAIGSYYAAREQGARKVENIWHVTAGTANLSQADVQKHLVDRTADFDVLYVPAGMHGTDIRAFVQMHGMPFIIGGAYYQLTKTEEVQPNKVIALREPSTGRIYVGGQARQLLGLPTDGTSKAKVTPGMMTKYEVFVQSTSVNRKLVGGTRMLRDRRKLTDSTPTWDHTATMSMR